MSRIWIWETRGLDHSFTPIEDYWTSTSCPIAVEEVMLTTLFDDIHTSLSKLSLEEGTMEQKLGFL